MVGQINKKKYLPISLSTALLEHGFLKSVDESNAIKNANLMFNYLDGVIDEIGEANFLKVSTNNASNYVATGARLTEKMQKVVLDSVWSTLY